MGVVPLHTLYLAEYPGSEGGTSAHCSPFLQNQTQITQGNSLVLEAECTV